MKVLSKTLDTKLAPEKRWAPFPCARRGEERRRGRSSGNGHLDAGGG